MRPPLEALPTLEIPVRGGGATLIGLQAVLVHAEAHGAAGLAPVETGILEHLVETFRFGLGLHQARPWNDHGGNTLGDPAAFHNLRGRPQKTRSIVMSVILVPGVSPI